MLGCKTRKPTYAAIDSLPPIYKDPFDRILVAQATVEASLKRIRHNEVQHVAQYAFAIAPYRLRLTALQIAPYRVASSLWCALTNSGDKDNGS